jgi:thioredoxin reductase (NADPH)
MSYDLVIIGAGPAGLTAGVYSRSRKLNTLILDAGEAGGQLTSLYPDKGIGNYPGFVKVQAKKLAQHMIAHAQHMGCEIHENEKVDEILDVEGQLTVKSAENEYPCKAVIIAAGIGLFKPRKLGVKGEEEFYERGVTYKIPPRDTMLDQRVLFVGGGNSALEMALMASQVAETFVLHRRDKFRADEGVVDEVERSSIETIMSGEVVEIRGDDWVEEVEIEVAEQSRMNLEVDQVVINIGFTPELKELNSWELKLDGTQIVVDFEMRTSRRGIFACGDIVSYPGKYKQIVTGCGEAATAANSAYKYIKKPYWA